MPKYVATILIDVEEVFEGRKSDKDMIKKYLNKKIIAENVNENLFRLGKVIMKINDVKLHVMGFE